MIFTLIHCTFLIHFVILLQYCPNVKIGKFSTSQYNVRSQSYLGGAKTDEDGLIGIGVSYDMAWQRTNGGYSSNTGYGAAIGATTKKVLDYGTRTKLCRICGSDSEQAKPHDCRKNHVGSSKRMEPDVAIDLFQRAPTHGVKFTVYTGDDDSTTESHIRDKVPYHVEKQSDTIHTKRSLISKLYSLKSNQKFLGCSALSAKVIGYLGNCFGYCVAQNKGTHSCFRKALETLYPTN